MCVDTLPDGHFETALNARRFQIETLARDMPEAGYVVCALRDLQNVPIGLFTLKGRPKYSPDEWEWHSDNLKNSREVSELSGPVIGPRKGEWKCPEYTWWSPIIKVLDLSLPAKLIEREAIFELLSGRVLDRCEGAQILVEVWDVHSGTVRKRPLVIEFMTQGERRVVSAFRNDTPAGRELWNILLARTGEAPEIGPLVGTSIVLEDWEMSLDDQTWIPIKCDTLLVNRGRNLFEGWATFRTRVAYPGGKRILRCESVGDYYEIYIDGERIGQAGPRDGTWDGARDIPHNFDVELPPGEREILFRVRDWRAAGGMVGPVYFADNLEERIF